MLPVKRKLSEPSNVLKSLYDLRVQGTLCDVQIKIQGATLSAHACVLASCSSYFLQLFDLNKKNHWCARNPLVINLEEMLENSNNQCVICVSKLIDFMYLRELIILQEHYEHVVALNDLFRVFDSGPIGNNCKKAKIFRPIKNELSPVEKCGIFESDCKGASDSSSKKSFQEFKNKKPLSVPSDHSLLEQHPSIISKTENSLRSVLEKQKSSMSTEISKKENVNGCTKNVPASVTRVPVELPDDVNKETFMKNNCQFVCCNPEPEINSNSAKLRKRRKMFCELCNFSSVSIKKVLHHLQSTEHFHSTCPVCSRKISNIYDLKDHLKDHADSKPFICHICSKRNRYWDYHKMHLKIHCRNKAFYCDLCQRGFVSKRSLTEHLTTHSGSYLCKNCDYYTSDLNMYRSHMFDHEKDVSTSGPSFQVHDEADLHVATQKVKKFKCQICSEGFTQKKNLDRHVKLKHFDTTKYKCSMCAFISDRIDILSIHMKKRHKCTLIKEKKKTALKKEVKINSQPSSEFVSVLIPVKILSDNSCVSEQISKGNTRGVTHMANTTVNSNQSDLFSSSHTHTHQGSNVDLVCVENEVTIDPSENERFSILLDNQQNNSPITAITKMEQETNKVDQTDVRCGIFSSDIKSNFISVPHQLSVNKESYENISKTLDGTATKDSSTIGTDNAVLDGKQYIWLNETTGELNDGILLNMQSQRTAGKTNQNVSGAMNSDQRQNSVINEAIGDCTPLDFSEDNEEWQFPQTPQASLVGVDDCDNLFQWNQIDNSFYSTWVLNETTGELNMASFFSIQAVRNPSEVELDEKIKSSATFEDDDTALFLNEGTGDLSVIYFKPNGIESDDTNLQPYEKTTRDNLETHSDISDDDSDFLNEEFMRASANFMSQEENEKFLNELTGEFDNANIDSQCVGLKNQPENESYLNEETGEISWNIGDDSVNSDMLTKPDSLEYDFDDSLNPEDFEPFFTDVGEFSTQFGLDEASENWQTDEGEGGDTLVLNECTGELVKRS